MIISQNFKAVIPLFPGVYILKVLGVQWKDWCWSWNSNTLATWCQERTHLKRPWCWEREKAGREGDDRGWDGWMASPTRWTWVWVDSGSGWWTGRPGVLQFMGSQRVGHDWVTGLNWTELNWYNDSADWIRLLLVYFAFWWQNNFVLLYHYPCHSLTTLGNI